MATHTIVSKRTTPFTYTKWIHRNGQYFQDGPGIVINGGAGIVGGLELLSGRPLEQRNTIVPESVLTFVDDAVLEKLESISKFRKDVDRGIIVVYKNKKISQEKGDEIARKDMVPDEHIPTRPISKDEMENAGASISDDGSVNISKVREDVSPLKLRKQEAGLPEYVKKRNKSKRDSDAADEERASRLRRTRK